ncbi:MAG: ABC transporter ATP-binding protein [Ignavibacteriae bacterium]|nr:MAG: ABC transporter ATP-binding protein [Ignavibacteriota bacterium]
MIDIIDLSVQFMGTYLFQDVNLKILSSDKIALVGSNGTGKSTFLKILSGSQQPEAGTIQKKKGLQIGYLPQEIIALSENTIFDEVKDSLKNIKQIENEENEINHKLADSKISNEKHNELIKKLGELNFKKEEIDYYATDSKIEKVLTGLGFKEEDFSRQTVELSGGWQMRVELTKILLQNNDILLLDEPTNHLDIDSLQWLVNFLKSYTGAIILVSHDRYFVNNICSKTLEIYSGNVSFFKGNYNDYLNFKNERAERLKAEFLDQQKKLKQTEQFIERFRYKATKAKQVQSRIKQLEKTERIELTENENKINFKFFNSNPSGVLPIKVNKLSKSYGEKSVLENISFQIERGEKIALVGPNGAGKTTLSKIISNRLQPTKGKIELGHNVEISFYAQDVVDNLNLENDIFTEIANNDTENTTVQLRTILGAFLFQGDDVFKKIKILSGGEKSRVALAKVLLNKANTIILDEPTNHLDYDSKKIVQNALAEFKGTLIIVSHDVDFLKPIVTKVIEVRNKSIKEYYGGIEYYLSKREENLTEENKFSNNEKEKISRKDEKRIEAERRNKEFRATKDIKEKITNLETKIEKFETEIAILEEEITKEEIYSNPELAKTNRQTFNLLKIELDKTIDEWTETNEKLESILQSL